MDKIQGLYYYVIYAFWGFLGENCRLSVELTDKDTRYGVSKIIYILLDQQSEIVIVFWA
jgi:hypothetical protein